MSLYIPDPSPLFRAPLPRWVSWPAIILLGCACAGAGYVFGSFSTLDQLEEQTQTTVITLRTERVIERWHKAKDRIVYIEKTVNADGSSFEKRSEKESEREDAHRDTAREESQRAEVKRETVKRPDWRVGVQVGASLRDPALPIAGPLVIGVSVDARIAKTPFSVGLWGNTVGAAGVAVGGEF